MVRQVTGEISFAVILGVLAGLMLGLGLARSLQSLLYQVQVTDIGMLVLPCTIILAVICVAALPAIFRAIHIDPGTMLRAD